MNGRSRAYAFTGTARSGRTAPSIAFNDKCDAMVATVVVGHDSPGLIEPGALAFINDKTALRWVEATLGH